MTEDDMVDKDDACTECGRPLRLHSWVGTKPGDACVLNRDANLREQPPPVVKRGAVAVWDLVVADMVHRDKQGEQRYGTRLQPHNGRDALVDAYQEALDLCVYLRQALYERDGQ